MTFLTSSTSLLRTTNHVISASTSIRLPISSMTVSKGPISWCIAWLEYLVQFLSSSPTSSNIEDCHSREPSIQWKQGEESFTQMMASFIIWRSSKGNKTVKKSSQWVHHRQRETSEGIVRYLLHLLKNMFLALKSKLLFQNTKITRISPFLRLKRILKLVLYKWKK